MTSSKKGRVSRVVAAFASLAMVVGICILTIVLLPALGQRIIPHDPISTPTSVDITPVPVTIIVELSQAPIPNPTRTEDSLLGTWDLYLDWNCDNDHFAYNGKLNFQLDQVTMSSGANNDIYTDNANWTLSGNEIRFAIDLNTQYVGTVLGNKITGTMIGRECSGSWQAVKK